MKQKFTILFVVLFTLINGGIYAQNLIENWDGNGATGSGTSEPNLFGWGATPSVTWGYANQSGGIRFMDNPANYTYNGSAWTGRILPVRWDGSGGSSTSTVFSYPVSLEAGKNYIFTGKFAWNSNSSGTSVYTLGINSTNNNSGTMLVSDTMVFTSKLIMRADTMLIAPTITGTYYLTIKNNNAIMGAAGDLSIVEIADPCITDLNSQYNSLSLGDISNVTDNIILPAGTGNVKINWATSNAAYITNAGIVSRPDKYKAPVVLTASFSATCNNVNYSLVKTFLATVTPINPPPSELLAEWNFSVSQLSKVNDTLRVADVSGNNLTGKLVNEASIRTIGETKQYNVLDLGNNKGFFDMGTEIGKAIYSLSDYTICTYFRIDTAYKQLTSNGNFIWTFSNAENTEVSRNGYLIGRVNVQGQSISTNYFSAGNQAVQVGSAASQGVWHHMAYTQTGDTGRIYIDGVEKAKGKITNLPFLALPKEGLTGTLFNWLGRSNYESRGDVYLRQTLVYDFKLYNVPLSTNDMKDILGVTDTIAALNAAYTENPNKEDAGLINEYNNLTLGDLSAVTSDLYFPSKGTSDDGVSISWNTSYPQIISSTGKVTRPDYYNLNVVITATLEKSGQKKVKTFNATVLLNPATLFANDLICKFDFAPSRVSGVSVIDSAEKHFTGTLVNEASVRKIGTTNTYNVLDLGNGTGYFDMGTDLGKALYSLNDITISCYYLIDSTYNELTSNGNFLWSLSNTDKVMTDKNGYIFGSLREQGVSMSSTDYTAAQTLTMNSAAMKNNRWHHMAYTQEGSIAVLYLDGMPAQMTDVATKTLANSLPKDGRLGTLYNWLGRSCYVGDVYLRKTFAYDFRIYKRALTSEEIEATLLKTTSTIESLNKAYIETFDSPLKANTVVNKKLYNIYSSNGNIYIQGITAKDKVSVYDMAGRQLKVTNPLTISANPGLYIVKVNNYAQKVMVP